MNKYHYVWLKKHPERTELWLAERLSEGFDIHHIDEDKGNNDPDNLVLIEHGDHMALHNLHKCLRSHAMDYKDILAAKLSIGKVACELRHSGLLWREVGDKVGRSMQEALNCAKKYAEYHGMEWPIPVDIPRSEHGRGLKDEPIHDS